MCMWIRVIQLAGYISNENAETRVCSNTVYTVYTFPNSLAIILTPYKIDTGESAQTHTK